MTKKQTQMEPPAKALTRSYEESPVLAVGRELTLESGIRAAAVWHRLRGELKLSPDEFEQALDLRDAMESELGEQVSIEGLDPGCAPQRYEQYLRLWRTFGAANWPEETIACYLALQGVPLAREKAAAVWAMVVARHMDFRHAHRVAQLDFQEETATPN